MPRARLPSPSAPWLQRAPAGGSPAPTPARALGAAIGNRGMARVLARTPTAPPQGSSTVLQFAHDTREELDEGQRKKVILAYVVNAARLRELSAYTAYLKAIHHPDYGDYFIALASFINDEFDSRVTVGLFKIMADAGVDVVKEMDSYSLRPLAAVAEFRSVAQDFTDLLDAGLLSEDDAKAVRALIADAESELRRIEGPWHRGLPKVKLAGVAGAAAAAWTATAVLAADDATVVGVADDVAIPFVLAAAVVLSTIAAFSGPKREVLDYAPAVKAVEAALREMLDLTRLSKAMETAKGNVADSGVLSAANALIAAGLAAGICAALAHLLDTARRAGDKEQMRKIISTQKAKGCRHSRASKDR